jgi:putative toxin-antitoxin system antitoxin component (TIGR02293 family)
MSTSSFIAVARPGSNPKIDREITNVIRRSGIDKKLVSATKQITYTEFLSNKMLMIYVIRAGIPYSLFNLIQDRTPFTEDNWAEILDISTKTLQRYKQGSQIFKSIQSEKIIEMAEVTNIGVDLFGDLHKFKAWLELPNFSLGNLTPLELLKDSYGKELVLSELTRINYGILS